MYFIAALTPTIPFPLQVVHLFVASSRCACSSASILSLLSRLVASSASNKCLIVRTAAAVAMLDASWNFLVLISGSCPSVTLRRCASMCWSMSFSITTVKGRAVPSYVPSLSHRNCACFSASSSSHCVFASSMVRRFRSASSCAISPSRARLGDVFVGDCLIGEPSPYPPAPSWWRGDACIGDPVWACLTWLRLRFGESYVFADIFWLPSSCFSSFTVRLCFASSAMSFRILSFVYQSFSFMVLLHSHGVHPCICPPGLLHVSLLCDSMVRSL